MTERVQPGVALRSELPYPAPAVGWYATIILAFLYWLSILDRFIISLLVDPIKRDMGVSDTQIGLLHGAAFAITFSLFGLIAGALADRFSRRWLIFASVSIWSLATAACGMAVHFWQLLVARVGVGFGEAGLNPGATSMLSDLFPRDRLTSAMAVYTIGATIGSGTAYLFGGLIVELVKDIDTFVVPIIGELRSWQAVFFVIGLPGVLIAFIVFTFPEPVRRDRRMIPQGDTLWQGLIGAYRNLLVFMRSQWRFFLHHYTGFMLGSLIMAGCAVWYPVHMSRTFGWGAGQIGLSLGLTMIVSSIAGKLICGYAADAMYRRGYRDAQFRWYAGCLLAAAPVGIAIMTVETPWLFLSGLGIFLTLVAPLPPCYITALNLVTPNELRGAGIAFFAGTAGLIGMGAGPLVIASISDLVYGGDAIGLGMATTIGICAPIGALLLATGCKAMSKAARDLEQRMADA